MKNVMRAGLSGVAGTTAMTLYAGVTDKMQRGDVFIPRILGTILSKDKGKDGKTKSDAVTLSAGYLGHYLVGFVFAVAFNKLWQTHKVKESRGSALFLGLVAGAIGAGGWYGLTRLAGRNTPHADLPLKEYLANLIPAHVIFAMVTEEVHRRIRADR